MNLTLEVLRTFRSFPASTKLIEKEAKRLVLDNFGMMAMNTFRAFKNPTPNSQFGVGPDYTFDVIKQDIKTTYYISYDVSDSLVVTFYLLK